MLYLLACICSLDPDPYLDHSLDRDRDRDRDLMLQQEQDLSPLLSASLKHTMLKSLTLMLVLILTLC